MIKLTELRIGNYLTRDGETDEVRGIFCQIARYSQDDMDYFIQAKNHLDYKLSDFSPIPLTAEWLLNLGFKIQRDMLGFSDTFWHSGMGLNHIIGDRWSVKNSFNSDVLLVHSVHELQNLFFALEKKELTPLTP